MASYVLQYVYVSLTGERFPFAYFSTRTASSTLHCNTFYEAVGFLTEGGFRIFFGIFDGASPNRSFFNSQFVDKDAISSKFKTKNKVTGDPLILIMDPSVCAHLVLFYNSLCLKLLSVPSCLVKFKKSQPFIHLRP